MSNSVENGSRKCQTGPTSADTAATPTQPYTHRKSVATSAALDPPAIPCATIQAHATSPMTRSATRSQSGGRLPRPDASGRSARTSRTRTNTNDRATVAAAPAR